MDYRQWLKREMERRCTKNARYSLRAFARDLELSPSHLSGVFTGRYGLSRQSATKIATRIGLNRSEKELFVESVESQHARSGFARKRATQRLRVLRSGQAQGQTKVRELRLDLFQLISDWFHFAILELTYLKSFRASIPWIARSLGISSLQARASLDRLFRLGLLKKEPGRWIPSEANTVTGFDIPSKAVRTFHSQILEKAQFALHCQGVEERDFRSTILAIRKDRLEEAKKALEKLHREFGAVISENAPDLQRKNEVYCLSTQFFSLTEGRASSGGVAPSPQEPSHP